MVKRFDDLNEIIQEAYGSKEQLAEVLNRGIDMLHYLEPNTYERHDVQNVASAMRIVCEVLSQGD